MALKNGLFLTLFLFTLQASGIKVLSRDHLSWNRNVKYRHFYEDSRAARHLSAVRDSLFLNKLRVKRSALFSTGVRACPQENMAEVITSHKSYYKLRVCQEVVWEAFQIFLDRVPGMTEFQQRVHACQTDSLCVEDLAHNFSRSKEHLDLVARRLTIQDNQEHAMATSVAGEKCSKTPEEKFAMDLEKTKVSAVQHIIEFSVTVKDPDYIQLQRDHGHVQYHDAPHSLHVQMLQIFNKLAGFKEIRLLGIQQMSSPESIAVHCAMVFETEVDSTRIGTTGTESDTEIALKDMILKALREDPSLPLDIRSLSFEPTTQNHLKDLPADRPKHLPGVLRTQVALAISEDTTESINISEEEAAPNGTQGRDEEAIESTFPRPETSKHLSTETTLVNITKPSLPEPSGGPKLKEAKEQNLITKAEGYKRNTSLDSPLKVSEVEQALGNEIAAMPTELNLNSMKAVRATTSNQYSESEVDVSEASFKDKISAMPYFTQTEMPKAEDTAGIATVAMDGISETPEASSFTESSEVPSTNQPIELIRLSFVPRTERTIQHMQSASIPKTVSSVDIPSLPSELPGNFLNTEGRSIQTHSSHQAKACEKQDFIKGLPPETDSPQSSVPSLDKDVGVFFSLKFTNMIFSEDLLNKSSPGYKSLEDTFLELRQSSESSNLPNSETSSKQNKKEQQTLASIPLLQFLQSDLTGFKELHILNFRNGSVVVNKKMKLAKPVEDNLTKAVHCTLDKLMPSNAASKKDSGIDSHPADPCKYMNCNEFSHCVVNMLSSEAECLCDPGYSTVDGLLCQSICNLQPNYCLNGGLCENIPGHGASCRCPSAKYWYYDGEHCSELVSVPVNPVIYVLCLMGSLTVVCAVIGLLVFINRNCIRTRKRVTLVRSHSQLSTEGIMRVNPVFENDDGILTHVSSISYPTIADSGSSQPSDQVSFYSLENMRLSIEIPRQLYTTRSEKLVSEIVGFHHCIPHVQTWRPSNEHRGSDSDGIEVTVL
ncbi:interphotoreceptor matrix proteoglycan 1 isoform X1 [Hemibagrus wyckioides]|uniref:interphotoreceptor matrix proteoglycan 1 isoform X1 n=1 Tax=Hemibagrus wyckioides TaxID=337641 RepID=UPI00266B6736|nr:interphotoreceptor matrix proteoglycan 1 isoform X1 [Hemibagrus wyckioides]